MKLIYFNARGRAELARLILAQAGEAYDDERIEGADWPKLKPSKPILIPLISNSMSELEQTRSCLLQNLYTFLSDAWRGTASVGS